MGLLLLIGLGVIVYLVFRGSDTKTSLTKQSDSESLNIQWAQFIAGYHPIAKSKAEKKLIERMLQDLANQGLPAPIIGDMGKADVSASAVAPTPTAGIAAETFDLADSRVLSASPADKEAERQQQVQLQLDNTTLLLYFGAFLFVASVGLFVAFGGLPGTVRTLAVALVAAVMYGGGLWLFRNKAKLEQAGMAFTGIGLATAPFVGLAAYNFVFNQTAGSLVWFMTSIACMALYLHALVTLKRPLLNYVLIFTFLSLIESTVSVINAPLYYFGWGLAATGIILAVVSHQKRFGPALQDASYTSANLFMPIASAASVITVGTQGFGQLGVSMLLAAAFYASEFIYGRQENRVANAIVAQVTTLISVGAFAYAVRPEFWFVATLLLFANFVQAAIVLLYSKVSECWLNFASILGASSIAAIILSLEKPGLLVIGLGAAVASMSIVWWRQDRSDAYGLAVIAWMIAPLVIGQLYLQPQMSIVAQSMLSLGFLLIQWTVLLVTKRNDETWEPTARLLYLLSSISVLVVAAFASNVAFLAVAGVIATTMLLLTEHNHTADWATVAGVVIALPVLHSASEKYWFVGSIVIALLVNIMIALRYRQEVTRWLGTFLWLLLPISLGHGVLGYWSLAEYAWVYMVTMAGLIVARAIARGVILASSKVPLASYGRSASISYVLGYLVAMGASLILSLLAENSQLHTSGILVVILLVTVWLARRVEKNADILVAVPLLAQGLLLSVLRIDMYSSSFNLYLLCSLVLAVIGYVLMLNQKGLSKFWAQAAIAVRDSSLLTASFAAASYLFVGKTAFMMPVGLLIFAVLLYHRLRETAQQNKELVGGLALVAIWWLMWYWGVRNVQAYTHVLALLFAAYAYWRHLRSETTTSDQYLIAMLATATIPLILQALGGQAGDLYGWWLLLEQVFFMLLGITIGKAFVTRWGLYVAVGAVLYQLRNLGWAALTVLALFLIGLAVYRLQKQDTK